MIKQQARTPTLEDLIDQLADDPTQVKAAKQQSVKDAIIALRPKMGSKVFTKRELMRIVETAYPELSPVAMTNLEASLARAKDYVEIAKKGEQNVYRLKERI